ncbi:MAG TPA: flagellin [Bryocella sp.]|nr:flagellin [Bryocella sp.]
MAISILNNIPAMAAENQLSMTQANLQNTLEQLASGSRINSGADDAAGLAIVDGLQANVTALTQSALNANEGVGKLQVADGALSQVTDLLNRAVTLATESANGTVNDGSQRQALDAEFQSIAAEINRIGTNTTYNGSQIFTGGSTNYNQAVTNLGSDAAGLATKVSGSLGVNVWDSTTGAYVSAGSFNATTSDSSSGTVGGLIENINNSGTGLVAALNSSGNLVITDAQNRGTSTATAVQTDALDGGFVIGNTANPYQYNQSTATNGGTITLASTVSGELSLTQGGAGGTTYTVNSGGTDTTVAQLISDIDSQGGGNVFQAALDNGKLVVTETDAAGTNAKPLTLADGGTALKIDGAAMTYNNALATTADTMSNTTNSSTMNVFLSDSTTAGSSTIGVTLGTFDASNMNGISIANDNLQTASAAQTALSDVNNAISQVAALRGSIGAGINRLNAATNVMSTQTQNLTSAEDGIQSADMTQVVANLTNYQILDQTGISALAQANQVQENVLKLLQ